MVLPNRLKRVELRPDNEGDIQQTKQELGV